MTIKQREKRNQLLLEYRKFHTLWETSLHFRLTINQVYVICKKNKFNKKLWTVSVV